MNTAPDNTMDTIDSRAIIDRIGEIENEISLDDEEPGFFEGKEREEALEELAILRAVASEGEDYSEWPHGTIMVRESYKIDYVKEYYSDTIDGVGGTVTFLLRHVDWAAAADEFFASDWTEIEFDGVTYLVSAL